MTQPSFEEHLTAVTTSLEGHRDRYLQSLQGENKSPATIDAYRLDLTHFLVWLTDSNYLADQLHRLTRADIQEYVTSMAQRGNCGRTRARRLAALRGFFNYLVDNNVLKSSPAERITTPLKEKRVRTYMQRHEYKELIIQASRNVRDTAIVQLLLQTGIRVSELCGLNKTDVDFRAHRLTVQGKGNKERTVPVPSAALDPLKQYLELRGFDTEEALLISRFGERLTTRSVQKLVEYLREKAGIDKPITPHTFRHTYISHHARSGFSAEQLMPLTGHEHASSTLVYIHDISTEQMMRAVERNALV